MINNSFSPTKQVKGLENKLDIESVFLKLFPSVVEDKELQQSLATGLSNIIEALACYETGNNSKYMPKGLQASTILLKHIEKIRQETPEIETLMQGLYDKNSLEQVASGFTLGGIRFFASSNLEEAQAYAKLLNYLKPLLESKNPALDFLKSI